MPARPGARLRGRDPWSRFLSLEEHDDTLAVATGRAWKAGTDRGDDLTFLCYLHHACQFFLTNRRWSSSIHISEIMDSDNEFNQFMMIRVIDPSSSDDEDDFFFFAPHDH
jgi:hypothetical protein